MFSPIGFLFATSFTVLQDENMINKTIRDHIKLPSDKYEFYDEYLPEELKESFKKPIGLYDPYSNVRKISTGSVMLTYFVLLPKKGYD
mgnify:CR=1 FL=1